MSNARPRQAVPGSDPSHAFSKVAQADIQRSAFDLSRPYKTTLDPDYLYPVFSEEVIPGDTFTVSPTLVAQMLSLKQQLMDSLYMDIHYWFVPNRLTWVNWQRMQGERDNPDDSIDYTTPQCVAPTVGGWAEGSIYDYMTWPTKVPGPNVSASALYLRALNLTYNTWYRDENLIDSVPVLTDNGPDPVDTYKLLKRGKRKDYFTSCLPWAQKGDAVTLPIGGIAPVSGTFTGPSSNVVGQPQFSIDGTDWGASLYNTSWTGDPPSVVGVTTDAMGGEGAPAEQLYPRIQQGSLPFNLTGQSVTADLSAATAVTINALRLAITIQQLLERDARGGTRYTEIIHSHFGVVSPDARMQRPEYLGGGTIPVLIHSVVNTTQAEGTVLGNRAAYGHAQSRGGLGFTQSFTEHGVILGLLSIRQEYTYQQGIDRRFSRLTRYDYYMPTFANLGEQPVLKKELVTSGNLVDDNSVFGYQERWAEYRCAMGHVTGKFRSNATGSLDVWHLAQVLPATADLHLDQDFVEENIPLDRVVNVPSEPIFQVDMYTSVRAVRPLPIFSVPGLRVL